MYIVGYIYNQVYIKTLNNLSFLDGNFQHFVLIIEYMYKFGI